jgi:8-oxo-dGTP pyrophosphatase MutT (NUDIX family)
MKSIGISFWSSFRHYILKGRKMMSIRNAAKAIICSNGKILLVKYKNQNGNVYYELPGGGQHQFETMEEAVIRECKEETGYLVRVVRMAALAEEIFDDQELRREYPDYVHRIHHIFRVEITEDIATELTEMDYNQEGTVWMEISNISEMKLIPRQLRYNIHKILESENPIYLGVVHEENTKHLV